LTRSEIHYKYLRKSSQIQKMLASTVQFSRNRRNHPAPPGIHPAKRTGRFLRPRRLCSPEQRTPASSGPNSVLTQPPPPQARSAALAERSLLTASSAAAE